MNKLNCHAYALLTVVLWASSYICTRLTVGAFTSISIGVFRCLVGAAILGVFVIAKKPPLPRKRDLPWFLLSGLVGIALYLLLFNQGMVTIDGTTSCIIIATAPIITALLAAALFGENLSPLGWLAIALAFSGILVLALWDGTFSLKIGILWTQAAAFVMAVFNISQRKLTKTYAPALVTSYSYFAAALLMAFFAPAAVGQARAASGWQTLVVLYMGVFPSAVAYLSWAKAISIAPKTSYVTNYMFLTPFFAGVMEYAVTGQAPNAGTIIGGGIILGSLALFSMAGKKGKG